MVGARRTACIGERLECLATLPVGIVADGQVALDQEDFLPVLVHEWRRRVGAGIEVQEARPASTLVFLVERARENLLLDTGRITGGNFPSGIHVERMEFI